mgnify:CR=1 FL=1
MPMTDQRKNQHTKEKQLWVRPTTTITPNRNTAEGGADMCSKKRMWIYKVRPRDIMNVSMIQEFERIFK